MNWKVINANCLDVMKTLSKEGFFNKHKAVIVTDPPFNIGYHYNTYTDNMDESEYYEMLGDVISNLPCVIIHYPESLYKLSAKIGRFPNKVVSWVYNSNTAKQHRDIAFFDVEPDFKKVRQPYKNPTDKRIAERIANGAKGGAVVRLVGNQPS